VSRSLIFDRIAKVLSDFLRAENELRDTNLERVDKRARWLKDREFEQHLN